MVIYCPKSRARLEAIPPADALDANAVIDYCENGELIDRACAILDAALNTDAPEPYEAITGLMFNANAEPSGFVESLLREGDHVYRITVLDNNTTHTLLYRM